MLFQNSPEKVKAFQQVGTHRLRHPVSGSSRWTMGRNWRGWQGQKQSLDQWVMDQAGWSPTLSSPGPLSCL